MTLVLMAAYFVLRARVYILVMISLIIVGAVVWFSYPYSSSLISKEGKQGNIRKKPQTGNQVFQITWYNPPYHLRVQKEAFKCGFKSCRFSNCRMQFGSSNVSLSDAVIFDGHNVKPEDIFHRKPGQVWIFSAYEAPAALMASGDYWTRHYWVSSFNWTMTYDKSNTDIFLPYGEIRKLQDAVTRDLNKVFTRKNKTALIVHSHCSTFAKRNLFVKVLDKHIEIDSFGDCGSPLNCGNRFIHDNCFDIINGYKLYLAFENAICNEYFTEKLFRNFNYDSIMVVRGGRNNDIKKILPDNTYISTNDFKSIKELAIYLKNVSTSETLYTELLKRKSQYYSVPFKTVYQRAMCDLCERMNQQERYRKQIANITDWAFGRRPCQAPTDMNET